MQRLKENMGTSRVLSALGYFATRAGSRPETRPWVEEVRAIRKQLDGAHRRWLDARESRQAESAELSYLEEKLDEAVMDLSRELLFVTRGERDDPRFLVVFPESPSRMLHGKERRRAIERILAGLGDASLAEFAGHEPRIRKRFEQVEREIEERERRYQDEALARSALMAVQGEAVRRYRQWQLEVAKAFPCDEPLAESFFRRSQSARRPVVEKKEEAA